MNKLELIDALKKETGLKKYEAKNVIDLFFDEIVIIRSCYVEN